MEQPLGREFWTKFGHLKDFFGKKNLGPDFVQKPIFVVLTPFFFPIYRTFAHFPAVGY